MKDLEKCQYIFHGKYSYFYACPEAYNKLDWNQYNEEKVKGMTCPFCGVKIRKWWWTWAKIKTLFGRGT